MAKIPLISTGLASALVGGTTYYSVVAAAGINFETTEANAQLTYRTAGVFSGLFIHVLTNATLNASTLRIRINGANGNQSVSIPAATTGSFEDTTNSDTIASGDKVNYSIAVGSGLGNITAIREISTFFAATTDTVCRYAVVNIPALTAGTGNYWYPLSDVPPDANGTEARSVLQVNAAATFQDFFAYVSANGVTAATVLRFRLNGANATMTVSYGSGVTGILEDTTHTDATVANDNMGFRINLGGTGTTITIKILAVSGVSTDRSFHFIMGNTNGESGSTNVLYFSPSGRGSSSTTEANKQVKMRIAALISNVFVVVSANTANGTSTFKVRKNGVDTAISASIPAATTGSFEGTSQEAFAPTDLVSYALTRGGTGTVTIRSASSLVIAMTEANDTRAAEVTGKDTSNSSRAAEVTGKDTANDTRAAEVTGKDTSNSARAAEVTGTTGTDIERISSGSGSGSSISLGTHLAGDLIFIWAYRNNSATAPSLPSGWTQATTVGASVHSAILGYKIAASSSETSGTWTNATSVAYAVYRNIDPTTPVSHPSGQSGTTSSVSWSGIAPSIDNPGRDWVLTTYGAQSDAGNIDTHPPTDCTLVTDYSASGTEENTLFDTNGPVSSYSFNTKTADASITWLTKTISIRAVPTGTSDNSSRAAEVTGKDTSNDSRAAEVTGKDTSNSARAAETTGKDTSSDVRAAETTGVDTANSARAAEVTGKDTSSDARAAETTGLDIASDTRASEVTGKDIANDTRAAETTGIEGSQSERASEVSGTDTTNSSRSAEVSGKENHPLAKMTTLLMALDTNGRTAAAAIYMALYSSGTTTTSLTKQTTSLMPVSGKVKRLLIRCEAGPGVGITRSFTIQKNGVDTGIVVTLTGSGTGNGVSYGEVSGNIDFAAGESLNLKNEGSATTTDSGSTKVAVEVECAEYTSMLLTGTVSNLTNAVDNWMPIQGRGSSIVSAVNCTSIFPTSGVIQNARAALSGPPGSAKTYTFTLYKNGVATAITFTISGASATEGSDLTHSVSVVAGDKLYWHVAVDSGATNRTCTLGAEFRPTINGESVHTYATSISTTDTAVRYQSLAANNDASYQSSPVNRIFISTIATYKKFYLEQDTAPGASENYLYQLEVSASAGNPSITVSTGQTSGNDTVNEKTVADFDSVVVKITPTNTPGATVLRYSMVSFIGGIDHTRLAEVTGKDISTSERLAETSGVDTANNSRAAEVTGKDTANDSRAAETTGIDGSNSSRSAEVTGKDTSNSARAAEIHGKSGAYLRSSSSNNAASGTNVTITKPSGVQSGDVLIFIANLNGNPTTLVDNNGATPFTLKETKLYNGTGGGATMHIFYRVAGASEPSSYSFTAGASGRWQATMLACGQVDVNNIFGSYAGISEVSGAGLTFSAAAIAVNKDELAIAVSGLDTATQIYDSYPGDGYVLKQAPVANQALAISTKNIDTTGTQSAVSWHITSGSSNVIAYQFSLQPDSQSVRAAETTGKDTSNSSRAAEVTGKDTANDSRVAEVTGKDTANDNRAAELMGKDISSSVRSSEVTGKDSDNSARAAETTGKDTSFSSRLSEVTGQDSSQSSRASEVSGKDVSISQRNAEVTGGSGVVNGITVTLSTGNFVAQLKSGSKGVKLESGDINVEIKA